jgi:hypothetical protein
MSIGIGAGLNPELTIAFRPGQRERAMSPVYERSTACYNPGMNWLRWNPDLAGNFKTLLLVVLIVGGLAVTLVYYPIFPLPRLNPNAGFGPDWDCTAQVKGDPVCIKKLGRPLVR